MTSEEMKRLLESPLTKAWLEGGQLQMRTDKSPDQWRDISEVHPVTLLSHLDDFRIKPKPQEWWEIREKTNKFRFLYSGFPTREEAERKLSEHNLQVHNWEIVHVREVLE